MDLNGQFQSAISALENYESSLNGMWDGDANDMRAERFAHG